MKTSEAVRTRYFNSVIEKGFSMEKLIIALPDKEEELIDEIRKISSADDEVKSNYFDADANTITLMVAVTPVTITALGNILVKVLECRKKSIKFRGIEMSGFSKKEIYDFMKKFAEEVKKEDDTDKAVDNNDKKS